MPKFPMRKVMPWIALLAAAAVVSAAAHGQSGQPQAAAKSTPARAPKRNLSGIWQYQGNGSAENLTSEADMPPMTPWAKALFDKEIPGYGTRATPGGNDPILQCDPMGFPRIMYMPQPFEFVQIPGRLLQFWEREHEWRPIWLGGRSLPKDADPTWYGYAVGHWEGDHTLVTEASGFNDRTWLGPYGYPHSDEMTVKESYNRVDNSHILYNITVTDPKAYTRPIVGQQKTMLLKPHEEIDELVCDWAEENAFDKRIREPAAAPAAK